jgi:hypothetical protein
MRSFPKIFQLGTVYVQDIFKDEIEITEKLDGSQFKFGLNDEGKLEFYSKGAQIYLDNVDKLFKPAVAFASSVEHLLEKGHIYYGETFWRPKHNVLTYNQVPTNNFTLFGVSIHGGTAFFNHEKLTEIANLFNCDVIPLLFKGHLPDGLSLESIKTFLDTESYLGGVKIEGIVIKNYYRSTLLAGHLVPITCAKYVSEAFKEKHITDPDWQPSKDKITLLYEQYKTEARWLKAIQHLNEANELTFEPRDIGKLLKEIVEDTTDEYKEEIKEELWQITFGNHKGCWTRGFPEFYKNYLLTREK